MSSTSPNKNRDWKSATELDENNRLPKKQVGFKKPRLTGAALMDSFVKKQSK